MRRFFTVALTLACLGLLVGPPSASAQGSSAAPSSDSTTEEARHLLPFWLDKVPEEYRGQVPLPIGISFNFSRGRVREDVAGAAVDGLPVLKQSPVMKPVRDSRQQVYCFCTSS
jgi:hypothetical protein